MKLNTKKIKKGKSIKELLEFGIINIDKPSGPTSFDISDFVRKTLKPFGMRKTSHFGTLDPKVTGVLPIALNRACKLTGFFLGEDKEYVGIMDLHGEVSLKEVEKVIGEKFLGKITQLPPVRSRVARVLREREVKRFEIIENEGSSFLFVTEVQGGTYIRKLVHDLGEALGIGAHMLELRRIRAGIFKENDKEYPSVNLYDFEKAVEDFGKGNEDALRKIIIPGEKCILGIMPSVEVKLESLKQLLTGKPLMKSDISKKLPEEDLFAVFNKGKFLAIMKKSEEGDILAKPEFVYN